MKKTFLLALAVTALGLSTSALAQTAGPKGFTPAAPSQGKAGQGKAGHLSRKEMETVNEDVLSKLGLTDDQKAKIVAHQKETDAKLLELRKANKGAKGAGKSDEVKEKVKSIRKENQDFMKSILTKDQMKQMARLRREELKKLRDEKNPTGETPATTTKP